MTSVPLHPALVHVPLGLAFVLPLVAAGLALGLWRGFVTRRAFLILVALQGVLVGEAGGELVHVRGAALAYGASPASTPRPLAAKHDHDHDRKHP